MVFNEIAEAGDASNSMFRTYVNTHGWVKLHPAVCKDGYQRVMLLQFSTKSGRLLTDDACILPVVADMRQPTSCSCCSLFCVLASARGTLYSSIIHVAAHRIDR